MQEKRRDLLEFAQILGTIKVGENKYFWAV